MTDASINTQTVQPEAGFGDYVALLKPRVMSLVVFTALVGLLAAPMGVHPMVGFASILFIAVGAGASGALNMWWDADIDAVMKRTAKRPVPAGKVEPGEALAVGVALSGFAIVMLALASNMVAAGLLAFTIFFYAVVYTMWLTRWTPQNIVIGGAAGAFPPMIGWAVATGGIGLESVLMFGLIFMWTPPHFWALSLWRDIDYAKAGVPMLPVVAGRDVTRRYVVLYSVLLFPIAVMPYFLGYAGMVYGAGSAILSGLFLVLALKVWHGKDEKSAKQLFAFSLLYLFLLFAILLGESLARTVI